jgi:hypothetical protein
MGCRVSRVVELDELELQGGASTIDRQDIHNRRRTTLIDSMMKNGKIPMAPINAQSSIGNEATLKIGAAAGTVSTATCTASERRKDHTSGRFVQTPNWKSDSRWLRQLKTCTSCATTSTVKATVLA